MATQKTAHTDKYANYRYEIVTPEELREAKWLIKEGLFDDMDDYIDCTTKVEIRMMKREDARKKKLADARKRRRIEAGNNRKAA